MPINIFHFRDNSFQFFNFKDNFKDTQRLFKDNMNPDKHTMYDTFFMYIVKSHCVNKKLQKNGNIDDIQTDTVFHILNSESRWWNLKIKSIGLVNDDWNTESRLLKILTCQFVSIQIQYRNLISTAHTYQQSELWSG